MSAAVVVRKDSYHDSILLMRLSQALAALPGVEDAVVAMGTPQNRELLASQGYDGSSLADAGPNDLVIAVKGEEPEAVEAELERLLRAERSEAVAEVRPASLAAAARGLPGANLVLVSVPGAHAAREARRALALGCHVMVFSDNVSLEEEIELKREAVSRGLLMMGPDCGTAILGGKPLAFANVVRRGPIGIVGAAGTGIQEVSSCIDRLGGGVSQAIGTGGRDLSEGVGGTMTLFAIEALAADEATEVIAVVSKPPAPAVAERVLAALAATGKPCAVHFVGAPPGGEAGPVDFADSLAGLAATACRLAGVPGAAAGAEAPDEARADELAALLAPDATLRALFCGGTTGQEALAVLARAGLDVRSNLHKQGPLRVDGTAVVEGDVLLDLGDDVFTAGRPHPMIEPQLRNERLALELAGGDVGLLLFDCVLGYGSHPDPAGVLAEGVARARAAVPGLVAIASVTGTHGDPQGYESQVRTLTSAGVAVEPDNYRAALLAAAILERRGR